MRNIIERAAKTFIEAFIGTLAITLPNADLTDKSVLYSIVAGAIATGISAVLNLTLNYMDKKKNKNS
jgi:hypothetical protein